MTGPRLILIIDNAESERLRTLSYLHEMKSHLSLQVATSGQEGIEAARRSPPDCILLHAKLPDLSGIKVLEEIRAFTDCPIILLSKNGPANSAQDTGAEAHLSKDHLDRDTLMNAIQIALQTSFH